MKKQRRGKKKLRKEMIVSVSASASAGATLPNLPNEIKDEIFSRLPVKTLLDFRCISRDYYSPFHNPNFIKLHLNRQMEMDNGSTIIIPYGNMIHKVNIDKFRYEIPLDFPSLKSTSTSQIVVAGSYNGLVCLTHDPLDEDIYLPSSSCLGEIAYFWNPVTGDYKQLPAHNNDVSPYYRIALGFGYDRNSGKIQGVDMRLRFSLLGETKIELDGQNENV
ncbi:F-box protein CPR1-like [Macadamia integrifolia]|uniref:F-box protein CPR1-like n=1 Tax=Macadamia integrifolia TaxID=60698 RepID=UPI001C52C992|nr:F-box protein CPR1-like [Macadamia integrifolia]